jgi:hypothetical protein
LSRTRTRVPRWAPSFKDGLRLALRPLVAYFLFTGGGMVALFGTVLAYEHNSSKDTRQILTALFVGMIGIFLGQLVAVLRARSLPIIVLGGAVLGFGIWILATSGGHMGEEIGIPLLFFSFAFPCGLLSLQHRWELFASFWPAVGWIGAAFAIMNKEGRIGAWNEDKMKIWLPLPLAFLGAFLVLWLFFLASKQAMRVELWQTLSGAAARRVAKKERDKKVGALPRKNVLALLVLALALFGIVAVLAPYLFRTGKGGKGDGKGTVKEEPSKIPRPPKLDGDALIEQMKKMAQSAKDAAVHLWPLLFLIVLYRPAKRALLKTHLLTPVVPTPPTERIENMWEYVRIAAEDAGVVPAPSDSIEQLLARIKDANLGGPALADAARIYARTRYGFTVARGDALAMRPRAIEAAKELRIRVTTWKRVTNWWRPLS